VRTLTRAYAGTGQLGWKVSGGDGENDVPYESYDEDGQLWEKGTYNMSERCGEWIEDGETVTYDSCPRRPVQ
jgi:antitoxin component YwqK of YwqJK toxin-antitoxin module